MFRSQHKDFLPHFCRTIAIGALVAFAASQAAFAEYPSKSITVVVPRSAGGGQDTQARALATVVRPILGRPLQVVNKTGAAGFIGAKFVVDARPDGYTLMQDNAANLILPALAKRQVVDPLNDLEIIAMTGELYTALTVRTDDDRFPTIKEFVAYARKHPEMTYGFSGKGGFHHVAGLGVERALGYTARAVPFKGGGNVRAALLGGQIDFAWIGIQQLRGFEAKMKAIAVASEDRYPAMPDYPTFKEQGLPYTLVTGPSIIFAPKGLPKAVIAKLGAAIEKAVKSAKYADMIKKRGLVPVYRNAADAKAYVHGLAKKWKPLVATLSK
jgi:tripartite-type tricarboxylate transporter receptor subunit TctC